MKIVKMLLVVLLVIPSVSFATGIYGTILIQEGESQRPADNVSIALIRSINIPPDKGMIYNGSYTLFTGSSGDYIIRIYYKGSYIYSEQFWIPESSRQINWVVKRQDDKYIIERN
ncbi:hypothetical protein CEE37_03515 [candidate division LCP-89 bacterium B3_LCP]|uniref:Uncharacterized protein n=1 Tax=candidate division LCP-89 bacterium B3_LCP TaxID=2012998 RepID=A0A532V3D3_UNCL8|nr:MAG: hypothetical protein CEE37_03515 [candidate division LCP-89 bacterium B3_LCP]